jgi:hypothetical protein
MDRLVNLPKKSRPAPFVSTFALSLSLSALSALPALAQDDAPVVVTSPASWSTLRSDSVSVSAQVDTAMLPKGSIDFKVVRRSGARSSVLFSKSVRAEDAAVDAFLGRVKGLPIGGGDYLSIEWSVPGSELKGVVEPIGVAALNGSVSSDNKWVPSVPHVSAVRLKDGLSGDGAAEALAALRGFSVGGANFAAGWNASGLFLYFTPTSSVPAAEFALDLKFGSNAFTAWADKFVAVGADSAYGIRASKRSVDGKDGLKFEESSWGDAKSIAFTAAGAGKLVALDWSELGVVPFDGRNIGFAVFAKGQGKGAAYPSGAARSIPGTWGGISLAK